MTRASCPSEDGLVHLGMLYDGIDDLVGRALPEIRAVLDEGGDVRITVERSGVRELRHALGPDAERVRFPSPTHAFAGTAPDFVAWLDGDLPRDRRTLLVAQYSSTTPPLWDSAHAEDAVNLVLTDLPVTVICACSQAGPAEHRELTGRSHTHLLDAEGRTANDGFRAPDPASPAPLAPWGPPAVAMTVSDGEGLAELRARVAAAAAEAGLDGHARDAAVLAAHEAVLLAGGADPDAVVPLDAEHAVEVRAHAGALLTEVRTPVAPGTPDRDRAADWRRELLPGFCARLATHRGPDDRQVRVLSTR